LHTIGRAMNGVDAAGRETVTMRLSARAARALHTTARLCVTAHAVAVDAEGTAAAPRAPRRLPMSGPAPAAEPPR
jgi:hypothetical protein